MSNATLNAIPSPKDPASVLEDDSLGGYIDALYACDEILRQENSLERRMETERCRAFFKSVIDAIEGGEGLEGAPAPPPPPAPMPMPQQAAAPGPMGAPPAAGPPSGDPMGGTPPEVSGGASAA